MTSRDALEALARLAEIAFVGRVMLSLCPPGLPGRHGFRDIAATWAASHVLGSVALALESRAAGLVGLELPALSHAAPWLLVAVARWVTLPGRMVPRHEPLGEVPGTLSRVLTIAAPLAVVSAAFLGATDRGQFDVASVVATADALALLACCSFAIAAARRAPLGRALVVLVLAAILGAAIFRSELSSMPLALGLGSGAAFGAVWLRRGDRRAAILAVVAFAGCGILGLREALFGAAGLFALWVHTPEPSKRSSLIRSLSALAPCVAIGWVSSRENPAAAPVLSWMTMAVLGVVALALVKRKRFADALLPADEARPSRAEGIETTRVERDALRDAVLLSLILLASSGELSSFESLAPALLTVLPMVLLELGLRFAPAEHPLGATARGDGGDRR